MLYRMTDIGFKQNHKEISVDLNTEESAICNFTGIAVFDFAASLFACWAGNAIVHPELKFSDTRNTNATYSIMTGFGLGWVAYNALTILACVSANELNKNPYTYHDNDVNARISYQASCCRSAFWNYNFASLKVACNPYNSVTSLVGSCLYYGIRQVTFGFIGAATLKLIDNPADVTDLALSNFVGVTAIYGSYAALRLIGVAFSSGKITLLPAKNYELTVCAEEPCISLPEINCDWFTKCCPEAQKEPVAEFYIAQELDNETLRQEMLERGFAADHNEQDQQTSNPITTMFSSTINNLRNTFSTAPSQQASAEVIKPRTIF